jgi:hypothetical protein
MVARNEVRTTAGGFLKQEKHAGTETNKPRRVGQNWICGEDSALTANERPDTKLKSTHKPKKLTHRSADTKSKMVEELTCQMRSKRETFQLKSSRLQSQRSPSSLTHLIENQHEFLAHF